MLPDAPPYMKWDEEVARQLTDFNNRLQHLERLEHPFAGCLVQLDGDQTLGNSIWETLEFDDEQYDDEASWDSVNYQWTAPVDGRYDIFCHIRTGLERRIQLQIDIDIGAGWVELTQSSRADAGTDSGYGAGIVLLGIEIAAGDLIRFRVWQSTATATVFAAYSYCGIRRFV